MYQFNKRFSLISAILCLGIVSGVDAAPSVRILGSSTGSGTSRPTGTSVAGAKTGETIKPSVLNANTGVKKSSSVKTMSPTVTTMQPVARTASNRIGTAGTGVITTATGSNRFPGIASKTNVQKSYNPGVIGTITPSDPNSRGYNIQEMSQRLGNLEEDFNKKMNELNLDNYYTKDEIDTGYYTTIQVDEKIDGIETGVPQELIDEINGIKDQMHYVYDNTGDGENKSVYFVADFDADDFFGENDGD